MVKRIAEFSTKGLEMMEKYKKKTGASVHWQISQGVKMWLKSIKSFVNQETEKDGKTNS